MAMSETIVDQLYLEFETLVSYLNQKGEISLGITADENFRKALLLAAASYFEQRICNDLVAFVEEASSKNKPLVEFVKNKAIKRQYHTFFDWESQNASKFFKLFGEDFTSFMKHEIHNNMDFSDAIKAFIELGLERNRLVHQDFGIFSLEKTAKEIYQLYKTAFPFVESMPDRLRQYPP